MEYFQGQGGGGSGSLDWRIQRHGGTYDWNSEGISRGGGGVLEETDKSVNVLQNCQQASLWMLLLASILREGGGVRVSLQY